MPTQVPLLWENAKNLAVNYAFENPAALQKAGCSMRQEFTTKFLILRRNSKMKKLIFKLSVFVILGTLFPISTTLSFDSSFDSYISDLGNPMTDNRGYYSTYILPQVYGGRRGLTNINGIYNLNSWGLGFPNSQFFQSIFVPYYYWYHHW